MARAVSWWDHRWVIAAGNVLGHLAAIIIGFVMMMVGLALGVTMIMLPVGVVIGLLGVAVFIAGIFGRFVLESSSRE
jgi:hypothetical protein